jgi:hypothetical protein
MHGDSGLTDRQLPGPPPHELGSLLDRTQENGGDLALLAARSAQDPGAHNERPRHDRQQRGSGVGVVVQCPGEGQHVGLPALLGAGGRESLS